MLQYDIWLHNLGILYRIKKNIKHIHYDIRDFFIRNATLFY